MAGQSPSQTGVNALSSRQSIFFENMDARVIGERKRRRSSNGYGASESDAVLQTAMGRAKATPFFERL